MTNGPTVPASIILALALLGDSLLYAVLPEASGVDRGAVTNGKAE